jgi:hypothetical protein
MSTSEQLETRAATVGPPTKRVILSMAERAESAKRA